MKYCPSLVLFNRDSAGTLRILMDIFVARQPIFNKNLKTFGYELLFRGGLNNLFPNIDGDTASSSVLLNSFIDIGMKRLTGGKKAFVNFTRDLLVRQVPCLFSNDILLVEILETIIPDSEVVAAIKAMVKKGYKFALDDFVFSSEFEPFIQNASIIKIDIQATPFEEAQKVIRKIADPRIKFLAEKVETHEEFAKFLEIGFSYFQGFFFSKPEIIQKRGISPSKMRLLQIIGEANRVDADFDRLENLIKPDVSLSYRLLQYMNSAFFNRPRRITSIREAILLLGLTEVRKLVTLIAASKLADSKPDELIRSSIMRARFCELSGELSGYSGEISELFLMGLFSQMDAILDQPLEEILEALPLSQQVKAALIGEDGALACYLRLVRNYEKGHWDACGCDNSANDQGLPIKMTIEKYLEAIGWADAFTY
jgi:c-di-GMP-related signal transduction protein